MKTFIVTMEISGPNEYVPGDVGTMIEALIEDNYGVGYSGPSMHVEQMEVREVK